MAEDAGRYLLSFDAFRLPHHLTDVLVVGTGVAGLSAALSAARRGLRVMILTKGEPQESNTEKAQGGVAAVLGDERDDSPDLHAEDTIRVGQGLCDVALVHRVVEEASARVKDLIGLGARFDGDPGHPARALEAGHSAARVIHARGDATGAEIRDALARAAAADSHVVQWADAFLVDVLTDPEGCCRGALIHSRGHLRAVWAGAVVMATGGYARIYRESTNVAGATGDGIAAAWRAGASVADMEFVQFHPTTLYLAGVPRLLLTEAIRGEGAHIVDDKGRRFLVDELERAELAPRDMVSRAIMRHLQRPGVGGVYLDLTHLDAVRVAERFPGVVASCRAHGLDIARDRIPVRPAAHYAIGGIRAGADGATDVPGLLAVGEASATGLHGANRLASNSLLEGLVLGALAGEAAATRARIRAPVPVRLGGEGTEIHSGPMDVEDLAASLRALLWREVGIERNGASLTGALAAVQSWEAFAQRTGSPRLLERLQLLDMLCVARLVALSALMREESRGTHFRRDFPQRDDRRWRAHIVHRRGREAERLPVPGRTADPDLVPAAGGAA